MIINIRNAKIKQLFTEIKKKKCIFKRTGGNY